jgi:N-acylglucosamine 2-epimerase
MAAWLRQHLFDHVLSFWERHGFDEKGGLFTCIDDRGTVLSTEKWLWSQWRAVWVFSRVHNRIAPDPKWLQRANAIAGFCARHGWDERAQGWVLVLGQDGRVLRGCESTYVDAFAVYALAELYQAGRDPGILQLATRTADAALKKLSGPYDRIPHFPYPIPAGAKPHGIPMLWSLSLAELGRVSGESRYLEAAAGLSAEIFRDFHRPDRNLVLEFVRQDGRELPAPAGTVVVPGHVIESMWFQAHVQQLLGRGVGDIPQVYDLLLRHLELGWDQGASGGIRLAVDADGRPDVAWSFADSKLWWPQTEALYASLLGWEQTRRPEFLDWYEKLWALCLEYYVDWQHGEWRQKLDRSLAPLDKVVALPVKDPFHLPRSLILQIELLEKGFSPRG